MTASPEYGPPYASYQAEIFLRGMGGETPAYPVSLAELALEAQRRGDLKSVAYVFGAAGSEDTMHANERAFQRWRIVPRILRDVSQRDLSAVPTRCCSGGPTCGAWRSVAKRASWRCCGRSSPSSISRSVSTDTRPSRLDATAVTREPAG